MSVAQTIYEQLGGKRFSMMTGASRFVGGKTALAFRLPGGGGFTRSGINAVVITLTPADLYTMEFYRIRASKGEVSRTLIAKREDVYCEQLQDVFTEVTGLVTSLGVLS